MSHYRVCVFYENPGDVDSLLAPYSENGEEYYQFIPLNDGRLEIIKKIYDNNVSDSISFEEWLTQQHYIQKDGTWGYMANTNAKWDYYTDMGPFFFYSPKKGSTPLGDDIRKSCLNFNSRRDYPYAFITPDGKWHSPGTVGWFAISDETPESKAAYKKEWEDYINSDADPYITFVDCHI